MENNHCCLRERKMYASHVIDNVRDDRTTNVYLTLADHHSMFVSDGLGEDKTNVYLALDPQYHPIPPDRTNPQSVAIYNEHKELAKEYLKVQQEIQLMSKEMDSLAQRLNSSEPDVFFEPDLTEEEDKLVRELEQEKENLLRLRRDLKSQLDPSTTSKKSKLKTTSPSSGRVSNSHPT